MMYVTQQRYSNGFAQKTYSWRTGKSAVGGVRVPPPGATQVAPGSGGLIQAVSDRRKYLEMVSANVAASPRYQGHALTGDSGHDFDTIKYGGNSLVGRFEIIDRRTGVAITSYPCQSRARILMVGPDRTFANSLFAGDPNRLGVNSWDGPLPGGLGRWRSSAYADAALASPSMGWGETVVELLTGNVPRLLASLQRRMIQGRLLDPRGIGKDLGSEYLNAQFGILPIMRDIRALILHLSTLQNGLYGSYRRSRKSPLMTASYRTTLDISCQLPHGYSGTATRSEGDARILYDERITMKLVRAQPTIASNTFLGQASEIFQAMGFTNPSLGWQVIPWSWLIDWVTNIGASIENAAYYSAQSGSSPSTYSYVTSKRITTHTQYARPRRQSGNYYYDAPGGTVTGVVTRLTRSKGSPFGFDFSLPSLSSGQWAILVALGLAKRP